MRAILEYELGNFDAGETCVARLQDTAAGAPPPGPIAEHVFMVGAIALTERIAGSDERLTSAAESADVLLSLPRLAPAMAMIARIARALIAVQRNQLPGQPHLLGRSNLLLAVSLYHESRLSARQSRTPLAGIHAKPIVIPACF